jgi:DNA polymerase/3'-5' exonuclease PolX
MSEGPKIARAVALNLAQTLIGHLSGVCERAEIAGSLRRGKDQVHDIEIVCIPVQVGDLFGSPSYLWGDVRDALSGYKMLKGGDFYQQYDLGVCKADVYVTTREKWGVIFTLRTGSADFSRRMVMPKTQGGYLPDGMRIEEGRLWMGSVSMETLEEQDLFQAVGMEWVRPENR